MSVMNAQPTPQSVLQQIAQIGRMDRGTLNVIRQGPNGPYFNHQCYEDRRNVSRYVPSDQVEGLRQDLENYRCFHQLVETYAQLVVERTRAERQEVKKKNSPRVQSSWPRTKKSKG